jgi:hypothetical protein
VDPAAGEREPAHDHAEQNHHNPYQHQHGGKYYRGVASATAEAGGSLSRGSQPNAKGKSLPTEKGYTNDLYAAEKSTLSNKKPYRHQQVPVSVVVICKKTWMCAARPRGPDIHCNTAGYRKMAKVFEKEKL